MLAVPFGHSVAFVLLLVVSWGGLAALLARLRALWACVASGILGVDVVHVGSVSPSYRAIEVVGFLVQAPLGFAEHGFQRFVALFPYAGFDVAVGCDAVEIVEVYLQYAVALIAVESKLCHHLVGDILCFDIDVAQPLCADAGDACHQCYDCDNNTFHSSCF